MSQYRVNIKSNDWLQDVTLQHFLGIAFLLPLIFPLIITLVNLDFYPIGFPIGVNNIVTIFIKNNHAL
jgi:hypothetical protein